MDGPAGMSAFLLVWILEERFWKWSNYSESVRIDAYDERTWLGVERWERQSEIVNDIGLQRIG